MSAARPRRTLALASLGALLVVILVVLSRARFSRSPSSPEVDTRGFDPAVARLIEQTLREVRAQSKSAAAWGKLGSVLMHYELPDTTSTAFTRAQQLSPDEPRWHYLHGLALMTDEPNRAMKELERAAELAAERTDAPRLRLAQFLAERGRNADAAGHFQQILRTRSDHAPALLGMARICLAEARLRDGTNWLAQCLEEPHTRKAARALLATLEQQLGNMEAADRAARLSARLPADEPWPDLYWTEAQKYRVGRKIWLEDAAVLLDQNETGAAEKLLREVTTRYQEDEDSWYLLGWALNRQGRAPEAEAVLREHLRRSGQSAKGHAQLAVALLAQKKFTEAVAVLETGAALKPTWREFPSNLGYAWLQLSQPDEAEKHYRQALALDPGFLPTYTALAELSLRRHDEREARRLLQQANLLDPDDPQVRALRKRVE
jgi:tetratricopeptide (TPR) repeat protein